ncbi:ABC-type sugar transport system, permease component [Sphaerochaeta pleomorpha str. Grapes]|uniref:sn-glycerol-3-phosphate transport system permease protein UgpE n=1 Tax=Sphaerochaeta pleomorpha (strain ATCC BAA-1885 / DSM 22778 / Grapes) TaxID=158190 RepID=G8QUM0_SPHPG|nr:carbohydrate ABC transporter permease [Sphaerochaeta pleomorpha]AEV30328.1 ABC-type sugar transport system, permease component [Sphaerochaeta pleomorpha str. Grapes]
MNHTQRKNRDTLEHPLYPVVFLIALVALVPFLLLILLSLKSPEGGLSSIRLIPDFNWGNFPNAWKAGKMGKAMANSFIMTSGGVILLIVLSSMAGYTIARFPSLLNKVIFAILLGCMMIPGIINTVPLYTLLIRMKGINTYWAMICVMATNSLPFSVFLYASFIRSIPISLEESAIIDGCSWFDAFWKITMPLLGPVTSSVVILQGVGMWNNYAQAVFFLQDQAHRNIPLAISLFFQQYGANWPLMAAAAFLGLLPAVLMFLVFQKYFISGITTGAIKG